MKILILEPYLTDSHTQWVNGLVEHLPHEVQALTMKAQFWKWRMHGAAVTLARQSDQLSWTPDIVIASDMLDLNVFIALQRHRLRACRFLLYFHENQLTYPISSFDRDAAHKWDNHYAFINYANALAADQVIFNSHYHRQVFLEALPRFLKRYPDETKELQVPPLWDKSVVIQPGFDGHKLDKHRIRTSNHRPIILWNHRWEYDKNPESFFEVLVRLAVEGSAFDLVVLGAQYERSPAIFEEAEVRLADHLLAFGYVPEQEYYQWLWKADIVVSTSHQDFFGISVVEAMYCHCFPMLPDRLAFPEHIPEGLRPQCLYKDDQDLYRKLQDLIADWDARPSAVDTLRRKVEQYTFPRLAPLYEPLFQT